MLPNPARSQQCPLQQKAEWSSASPGGDRVGDFDREIPAFDVDCELATQILRADNVFVCKRIVSGGAETSWQRGPKEIYQQVAGQNDEGKRGNLVGVLKDIHGLHRCVSLSGAVQVARIDGSKTKPKLLMQLTKTLDPITRCLVEFCAT